VNVTRLENLVLNAMARDLYNTSNGGYPTDFKEDLSAVWTWSVSDTAKASMSARAFSGVMSSLVKKGLATVGGERRMWHGMPQDDCWVSMTEAGFEAWRAAFPTKEASDAACLAAGGECDGRRVGSQVPR
jgi:hypothetical protein